MLLVTFSLTFSRFQILLEIERRFKDVHSWLIMRFPCPSSWFLESTISTRLYNYIAIPIAHVLQVTDIEPNNKLSSQLLSTEVINLSIISALNLSKFYFPTKISRYKSVFEFSVLIANHIL